MKTNFIVLPYSASMDARFGLPHPLGLLSIGTVLEKKGHKTEILDCDAMNINYKRLGDILVNEKPQLVGITSTTHARFSALKCVGIVKKCCPRHI